MCGAYQDFCFWKKPTGTYDIMSEYCREHDSLFRNWLGDSSLILEVGCGYGRLLKFFARGVGIDLSHGRLKYLHQHILNPIFWSDASLLPFKDRVFDHVYSCQALMHMPTNKILNVIREMIRVVKGKLVLIELTSSEKLEPYCFIHNYPMLFAQENSPLLFQESLKTVPRQTLFVFDGEN